MTEKIDFFKTFITEHRFELFQKVVAERTEYMTVLLEDIYQPQNASAVLRSCDCFGIQNVHIVENKNTYRINPDVALGSSKWLNLHKYNELENNTYSAVKALKNKGYRIVATSPHSKDSIPENFDIEKGKFALMFGSEMPGLSDIALENADEFIKIPMYGFTESFNISVSAAIIMNTLSSRMRQSEIDFKYPKEIQEKILLQWIKKNIKNPEAAENRFNKIR
ncbi:MAG: RNA methyltransferase [Bacteroidota bacterium]|nr:RNA methyltransferase [Bacteroidota bacterium]